MKREDEDRMLALWTSAYLSRCDRWPFARAVKYADHRALRFKAAAASSEPKGEGHA